VLLGCFGKKPEKRYYMLDYIPTPTRTKSGPALRPVTLRIKDFKVAEAYKRPEMVYRKSAHELQFYNYHRWAVEPEFLITDMVFKHLRAANLFRSISKTLLDFTPDFTLTGQVLAIEEYDNQEKWYAHLAISFLLEDTKTERQAWSRIYDVRRIVAQHEPVYVVRELSFLLEHIMDKVVEDLESVLPKYLPPKSREKKNTKPATEKAPVVKEPEKSAIGKEEEKQVQDSTSQNSEE
jgi:uncharacterized lipoprotein YmbA